MKKLFFLLTIILFMLLSIDAQAQGITAIKAGRLVDPETGVVTANQTILVEAGKIKVVGAGLSIPQDATLIDLSNMTVMPGLFDCHTHMCTSVHSLRDYPPDAGRAGDPLLIYDVTNTTGYRAIQGVANARDMLFAGFTTIRDVGNAANYADTDLRRAIENGLVQGPTMINAGRIIAPIGGQYGRGMHPERPTLGNPEYFYADTRDEMKKAIRENILYGAQVIKIVVDDQRYIYSVDDIRFIVDEARRAGLKVAAHCATDTGARNAAEAGVASIEHGFTMSDEALQLAKKNNVVLVGTDFTVNYWREYTVEANAQRLYAREVDRLKRAFRIGTPMAFGSDIIFDVAGQTRGEVCMSIIDTYIDAGLPAKLILQMMTTNAARLLGVETRRGAIKPGLAADIVATPANPLDDPNTLKRVSFVMKDGKVFRQSK